MLTFGANQESGARQSSNSFASGARQNSQNVLTGKPSTRIAAPPGGRSSICLGWDEPAPRKFPSEERFGGSRTPRNSSNVFASGARQNCQNVLTDVPTTRVKAPPGGRSSICFGWEDARAAPSCANHASAMNSFDGYDEDEIQEFAGKEPRARPTLLEDIDDKEAAPPSHETFSVSMYREDAECYNDAALRTPTSFSRCRPGGMRGNECTPTGRASSASMVWEGAAERAPPRTPPSCIRDHSPRTSSNAFASGARQNCNNVLTDRPSTRVDAPPGGKSSISLGWEDGERFSHATEGRGSMDRQAHRNSANAFASGARQNCHNVLTNVPTTRVAAPPGGRSSISLAWGDAEPSTCASESRGHFDRQSARRSANAFANGARQNCQNVLTDVPTTRVAAPPGGRSSISLGWQEVPQGNRGVSPRTSHTHARSTGYAIQGEESVVSPPWVQSDSLQHHNQDAAASRCYAHHASEASSQVTGSDVAGRAGKPAFDVDDLRTLKARMGRRRSNADSTSGSQVYDGASGFGNYSVPVDVQQRSASAPKLRATDDIEGSQPRKWKPAKAPRAPPGGLPTFHPAVDRDFEHKFGRQRVPHNGVGSNRDANAFEALRFFQEEERLGKHPGGKYEPVANKHDRDSHRYYLSAEGKADLTPGKAHSSSKASRPSGRDCNELLVSESTSAGSGDDGSSDCDSLPLGAEWSSCYFDGCGRRHDA